METKLGNYVVKLFLLINFLVGNSVQLFLNKGAPVIKEISYDYVTNDGSEVEILCFVHSPTKANVTWYYEDERVDEARIRIETTDYYFRRFEITSHLTMDKFNELYSGKYTCEASNEVGKTNVSVNLRIRKVDLLGRDCINFPEECKRLNQMRHCVGDDPSCKCSAKEIYSNGRCLLPVPLGGICHSQEECLFSDLNSECALSPLGARCMCRQGFQTSKGSKCREDQLFRTLRHTIIAMICFISLFAALTFSFILGNKIHRMLKSRNEIPFKRLTEIK